MEISEIHVLNVRNIMKIFLHTKADVLLYQTYFPGYLLVVQNQFNSKFRYLCT